MDRISHVSRRLALAAGCVLTILAAGCGGGGTPSLSGDRAAAAVGSVAVTLAWPTLTATGSNSLKLQVLTADGRPLAPAVGTALSRPKTTTTLANVPVGSLLLSAVAYPQAGGLGTPQAAAVKPVTIAAGMVTSVVLSLNTAATQVAVAPATVSLAVGAKANLAATQLDAAGATVLAAPAAACTWAVTSGTSVASVDGNGCVVAKAAGTAVVKASKPGSTLSASATITVAAPTPTPNPALFNMTQTLSDFAQRTTLAFDGLAVLTGNLNAQSFFPPGKVADYTGFQYLRDNDPSNMGHNTSFLTRVANNVIYTLNDTQFAQLKALAVAQQTQIDLYGYKRFPLMQAFRRLVDGTQPSGKTALNAAAIQTASRELYLLDGQISFDRALLYAQLLGTLTTSQRAYLDAMKGKGFNSWPDVSSAQINAKMSSLPKGSAVAVMTYASDLYSWYAGSVEADVYFCPERHGTYFGSFYLKDAPAVGHEGYSINEQLTATAGAALCDSTKGYVTMAQATLVSSLVDTQRANLTSIVATRTQIATLLRSLITTPSAAASVKAQVLALSGTYGELDGANNCSYATVFAQVGQSLTTDQKTKLTALRKSILSGKYADGTAFDFSTCTTPFLYSAVIGNSTVLAPYITNTDYLF